MKLVCSVPSISIIEDIAPYVDGIMLEDSKEILNHIQYVENMKRIAIYKLDVMMHPLEVEDMKKRILLTKDSKCLYYITDLGLAHMLKQLGLLERTIYDPITMITNSLDAKAYMEYGFHSIGLSNEITLKDTRAIVEKSNCKAFLQVFGYRLMLHTRRKLIQLYGEKIKKKMPKEHLLLREATRQDYFPIVEEDGGTKIYRSTMIHLDKELLNLPLEYVFIDAFSLKNEDFLQVIQYYHALCSKGSISFSLEALDLPLGDGFSYKDSVYMKEEF